MAARTILLNGVSSAGKTTLAKAIQSVASEPILHIALDDFIAMLPDGTETQHGWFPIEPVDVFGESLPRIGTGPKGEKLLSAMRKLVGELSAHGLPVIVDDVCDAVAVADYREQVASDALIVVKVTAPIAEIERRERARGDRLAGTAREQARRLHKNIAYDLEIATHAASPDDCARLILAQCGISLNC